MKTLQDHINSVIAEFDALPTIEKYVPSEMEYEDDTLEKYVRVDSSWLSSKLREVIQDFIRATEVEGKIIDEFLDVTPKYIESFADNWDAEGKGCAMCGMKIQKLKELYAALSAQKEKIKHYLGNG